MAHQICAVPLRLSACQAVALLRLSLPLRVIADPSRSLPLLFPAVLIPSIAQSLFAIALLIVAPLCTSLRVFAIAARVIAEPSPCIRSHTSQSHAFAFLGPSTRCHCGAIRFNAIVVLCVSSLVVTIQFRGHAMQCRSSACHFYSLRFCALACVSVLFLRISSLGIALPLLLPAMLCPAAALPVLSLLCPCRSAPSAALPLPITADPCLCSSSRCITFALPVL